jgi:predicted DNA-binding transcriptional regulator AlpA
MPEFEYTQDQVTQAGAIMGALVANVLWQFRLQHESEPDTVPFRKTTQDGKKKYLTAREACQELGIEKSKFYELKSSDPDFPEAHHTAGGKKYSAADVRRYAAKLKSRKEKA